MTSAVRDGAGEGLVDVIEVVPQHCDRRRERDADQRHHPDGGAEPERSSPQDDLGQAEHRVERHPDPGDGDPLDLRAFSTPASAEPDHQGPRAGKCEHQQDHEGNEADQIEPERRLREGSGKVLERGTERRGVECAVHLVDNRTRDQGRWDPAPARTGQLAVREVEQQERNHHENPPCCLGEHCDQPAPRLGVPRDDQCLRPRLTRHDRGHAQSEQRQPHAHLCARGAATGEHPEGHRQRCHDESDQQVGEGRSVGRLDGEHERRHQQHRSQHRGDRRHPSRPQHFPTVGLGDLTKAPCQHGDTDRG